METKINVKDLQEELKGFFSHDYATAEVGGRTFWDAETVLYVISEMAKLVEAKVDLKDER